MNTLHPEGVYDAEVIDHGLTETRNTGTPQVAVRFRTDHGEITGYFFLTDRAIEHTVEKLHAMGFRGRSFAELNNNVLVGNRCSITVQHEEYQGRTKARIAFVNEEGYEAQAEIRKSEAVARTASQFDALLRRSAGNDSGQSSRPARVEAYRDDSDSIPF